MVCTEDENLALIGAKRGDRQVKRMPKTFDITCQAAAVQLQQYNGRLQPYRLLEKLVAQYLRLWQPAIVALWSNMLKKHEERQDWTRE